MVLASTSVEAEASKIDVSSRPNTVVLNKGAEFALVTAAEEATHYRGVLISVSNPPRLILYFTR